MQADLIYNAHAGRRPLRREMRVATEYLEQHGWRVDVRETQAPLEATELAQQAVERGVDVVVAAGGDGTVNEVASGLINSDTALGVLPIGTTNVWALQMHIPTVGAVGPGPGLARLMSDLESRMDAPLPVNVYRAVLRDAARVLVEGQTRAVDVGQVNERHFLMWAGVGLDAAVTASVSSKEKKALGAWAFVGTGLDMLRDYKSSLVTLTLDGETRQVDASLIVVSNIQLYGGMVALGARAQVDDGKLDVCVFKKEGLLNYAQYVIKVASGQHVHDPQIAYEQAREMVVETARPLPVHVDDEPFTHTPVTIRVIPQALKVILPQDVPGRLFVDGATRA